MDCRPHCGACCIAPSIKQAMPGMPDGKPAGVACVHLDDQYRCQLFGSPQRPDFCSRFTAEPFVCGNSREQALSLLHDLELLTVSG